jgi:hypothetical protein
VLRGGVTLGTFSGKKSVLRGGKYGKQTVHMVTNIIECTSKAELLKSKGSSKIPCAVTFASVISKTVIYG